MTDAAPECRKCGRKLSEVLQSPCVRETCWLDFSPPEKTREVPAIPSPDYVPKVEK